MNRRNLLKSTAIAGAASLLSFPKLKAQTYAPVTSNVNGYRRFMLGDLEITILSDGHILQTPVQPFMAPKANAEDVNKLLEASFRPVDSVDLAMNVMLIKSKDKLVLLDAGLGIFADDKLNGWILKSLSDAGFKPADIIDVILSHAHPDHLGGLVDKQQKIVYPNAKIHISKIEYDFWMKATVNDFSKSGLLNQHDFVKQIISGIQQVLTTIKPQLNFLDLDKSLYDIFSFELAPGHTPGLTLTTITSGSEKLTYIADLIHSDVLLFPHPDWGFSGDTDMDAATATRIKFLKQFASQKTRIFAYHLPWPGLGYTSSQENAFVWIPEVFSTP